MSNPHASDKLDYRLVAPELVRRYLLRGMSKRFQERVRDAMQEQGVSKADLSRRSGVPYHALDKFLKRDAASTSTENAVAIARALGITVDGAAEYSELERLFYRLSDEQRQFLLGAARGLLADD